MSLESVEVVVRGFRAFVARDLDTIFELLDPDVEWRSPDFEVRGFDDREEVLRLIAERIEEGYTQIELEECVDAGDEVVVGFRAAWMEERRPVEDAEGHSFGVSRYFTIGRYFAVVTVEDGRVVRVQDYATRQEALAAVGLEAE